jgi:cytochrome c-type biogenesis protein
MNDLLFTQNFTQYLTSLHGSAILLIVMAFLGGILSSLSPCSLGLLPLIITYVGGHHEKKDIKLYIQVFFFVLGLALTLTTIGVICAATGLIFSAQSRMIWVLLLTSMILLWVHIKVSHHALPCPLFVKELPQYNKNNLPFLLPTL